jgi:oxalate decarboxylase
MKQDGVDRRSFLGAAAAALSAGALFLPVAEGQTKEEIRKGMANQSASNPGPVNGPVKDANGSSYTPPDTDNGDVAPFWYSFDLSHRRIQDGGWTRQVTEKDLPISRELAGVNMRLTAGSYRELHWHTANEWAYMLTGSARITVVNPDGTVFIDDVERGDIWYFPAGYPHSIQGLGPDGCEFLLVFDEGGFSEYQTFLLSDWLAHTPAPLLEKNLNLPASALAKLPSAEEYIFPGRIPGPLEEDRLAVGGKAVESKASYSFRMDRMKPTMESASGSVRVVDSTVFPVSKAIAGVLQRIAPGAIREMHWHPNASEWQYWIKGSGRMTVFASSGKARTMNFNPSDVGYVPAVAGHYIENTGTEEIVLLAMFRTPEFKEMSLNRWIRRLPRQLVEDHLHLTEAELARMPDGMRPMLP